MTQYLQLGPGNRVTGIFELPANEAPVVGDTIVMVNLTPFPPGWPEGATPTEELHFSEGVCVWIEGQPLAAAQAAAIAKTYIDVDAVYEAAIGRRATEYADAESEARAYAAAGYTGIAGEYVDGFARRNPTGIVQTSQWAAQQIIGRADAFNSAALSMRTTRFDRQADMRAATTAAELATAVTAWSNFIATLRAQLGV